MERNQSKEKRTADSKGKASIGVARANNKTENSKKNKNEYKISKEMKAPDERIQKESCLGKQTTAGFKRLA